MIHRHFVPGPEKVHEVSDEEFGPPERKLLMLEDDVDTACVLKEYLEMHCYKVTKVANGVEGLKHVMAADFDVILCDLLMPSLPGDMFYLAVQKTKPELCNRFVFMTGHKADPKWDAFIRRVGAVILWKPFEMHILRDTLEIVRKKAEKAAREQVGI